MPQISSKFSFTVKFGATAVSCGDTPISCFTCSASFIMLYPPTMASPFVGFVKQESILITVVFPAPFTPSSENNSPCRMSNVTLSTAVIFLYCFTRSMVLIACIFINLRFIFEYPVTSYQTVIKKCGFLPVRSFLVSYRFYLLTFQQVYVMV